MIKKSITCLLFGVVMWSGCNSGSSHSTTDYNAMAKELCTCMRPLADMNLKVKSLLEEGRHQEVSAMIPQIEKLSEQGEACAQRLEEKYGVLEATDENRANAALRSQCPDIARMISRVEQMENQ